MLFKIRNAEGKFSKGGIDDNRWNWGPKGKVWGTKAAFAGHLSLATNSSENESETPASLFRRYGECTVIEVDEENGGKRELPFKEWFAEYVKTSDKFRKIRRDRKKEDDLNAKLKEEQEKPWGSAERNRVIHAVAHSANIRPIGLIVATQGKPEIPIHYHVQINGEDYAIVRLEDVKPCRKN